MADSRHIDVDGFVLPILDKHLITWKGATEKWLQDELAAQMAPMVKEMEAQV